MKKTVLFFALITLLGCEKGVPVPERPLTYLLAQKEGTRVFNALFERKFIIESVTDSADNVLHNYDCALDDTILAVIEGGLHFEIDLGKSLCINTYADTEVLRFNWILHGNGNVTICFPVPFLDSSNSNTNSDYNTFYRSEQFEYFPGKNHYALDSTSTTVALFINADKRKVLLKRY